MAKLNETNKGIIETMAEIKNINSINLGVDEIEFPDGTKEKFYYNGEEDKQAAITFAQICYNATNNTVAAKRMMHIFDMSIYHLDDTYTDIYITTEIGGSLYVPVKAIVEKNYDLIIDRHTSYHKSYYNTADRKEYLDKALALLDSKIAKILQIVIEDNL